MDQQQVLGPSGISANTLEAAPRMKLILAKMTPSGKLNIEKQGRRTPQTESTGNAPTKSKKPGGGVESTGGATVASIGACPVCELGHGRREQCR